MTEKKVMCSHKLENVVHGIRCAEFLVGIFIDCHNIIGTVGINSFIPLRTFHPINNSLLDGPFQIQIVTFPLSSQRSPHSGEDVLPTSIIQNCMENPHQDGWKAP